MVLFLLYSMFFLLSPHEVIKKEVEKYIRSRYPGYEIYEFEIINLPDEYKKIQITGSREPSSAGLKSNLSIPVKVRRKDGSTYNTILSVKVKFFQKVYTCQRNINRKEKLSESDFQFKITDVTSLNGRPVAELNGLENYRSKSFMKEGEILLEEFIELIPSVNSGDPVKAYVISGNVVVRTDAVARQEGVTGQVIRISSKDRKNFHARVVDKNSVLIVE